jgi:hypothetical protein
VTHSTNAGLESFTFDSAELDSHSRSQVKHTRSFVIWLHRQPAHVLLLADPAGSQVNYFLGVLSKPPLSEEKMIKIW